MPALRYTCCLLLNRLGKQGTVTPTHLPAQHHVSCRRKADGSRPAIGPISDICHISRVFWQDARLNGAETAGRQVAVVAGGGEGGVEGATSLAQGLHNATATAATALSVPRCWNMLCEVHTALQIKPAATSKSMPQQRNDNRILRSFCQCIIKETFREQ